MPLCTTSGGGAHAQLPALPAGAAHAAPGPALAPPFIMMHLSCQKDPEL